ncbi:hypothetical protein QJS63_26520 [Pseudomonas juntendi]|nr:hypothetical protein QJS63_26520 [Pseudomonas juntendi]
MVSVPREAVVQAADLLQEYNKCSIARDLRAILAQPAEQHEAEPVALPARKSQPTELSDVFVDANNEGWNACLDEIAKLGPLYSRPVQGEPVVWSPVKPKVPGAYWVRGNGLDQEALIQVIDDDGDLRCNLHQRTTETDFGYGYAVSDLSGDFEWLGPLHGSPMDPGKKEPKLGDDSYLFQGEKNWEEHLDEVADQHIRRRMEMAEQKTELYREVERLREEIERRRVRGQTCANKVATLREELDKALEFVERLRDERETLRAQLADRDALLRLAYQLLGLNNWHVSYRELMTQIDAALSASAEHKPFRTPDCPECACVQDGNCLCIPSKPSAEPTTAKQETRDEMRIRHKREFDALDGSGFHYQECRCGTQGSYPLEVKHCVCGKAFDSAEPSAPVDRMDVIRKNAEDLSSRLKNACCQSCMSKPCDCAIQSAPVEHDHDALVAAVCVLRSQGLGNLSEAVEAARAALERKP